jgi:hypothetical protein
MTKKKRKREGPLRLGPCKMGLKTLGLVLGSSLNNFGISWARFGFEP